MTRSIVEVARSSALARPDELAFRFLDRNCDATEEWSFEQLDRRARGVAAILQDAGAPGSRALLLYAPGPDYVAAVLGCLYAGTVAVPVYAPDPQRLARSHRRLEAIARDADASYALTTAPLLDLGERYLMATDAMRSLAWLTTDVQSAASEAAWTEGTPRPDDLAYLQYTSGSTGTPKGVMVAHGQLVDHLEAMRRGLDIDRGEVMIVWAPPYHDMGLVCGVLGPIAWGTRSHLMSPLDFLARPASWMEAVSRWRGTQTCAPNFAFELAARKTPPEVRETLDLSSLELLVSAAEPIRADTIERFAQTFAPAGLDRDCIRPGYGLAESVVLVSVAERVWERPAPGAPPPDRDGRSAGVVACGRALPGHRVAVVDPLTHERCEPRRIGEIWAAGPSIGAGYWRREEESEETFRASIAGEPGPSWLRTGDLGFVEDGELFVAGRVRDLIVIRGRNHYPQDIEATVASAHPCVRPGCAAAFGVEGETGERLVVVTEVRSADGAQLGEAISAIRRAVRETHEVEPAAVVLLAAGAIPKTSSGKIQRAECRHTFVEDRFESLLAWRAGRLAGDPDPPRSMSERLIAEAVAELLDLPIVGINDDLFDLGADSLAMTQIAARMLDLLGAEVTLADLFESPTVAQLAALTGERGRSKPVAEPVPVARGAKRAPLSAGQEALWWLEQLTPGSAVYNVPAAVRLRGALDEQALRAAVAAVVDRHDALRTRFVSDGGQPLQVVEDEVAIELVVRELDPGGSQDPAELAASACAELVRLPFDLERGPLLRALLVRIGREDHVFALCAHHAVVDGGSYRILLRELAEHYAALTQGRDVLSPPPALQFSDFAAWQRDLMAAGALEPELEWWRSQLDGAPAGVSLPYDRSPASRPARQGGRHSFELGPQLAARLRELGRRHGATRYMVVLAAFAALLGRYGEQDELVIGSPFAGRLRRELEDVVGFFVQTLPLRIDLSGSPSFEELIVRVRRTVLGALAHGRVPFERIVQAVAPHREPGRNPLFQVMVAHQRDPVDEAAIPGLRTSPFPIELGTSKFDLMLGIVESPTGIAATLEYDSELFERATAVRVGDQLRSLIASAIDEPGRCVGELPLPDEEATLARWNDTALPVPTDIGLHVPFERQAQRTPDAVAVIAEDEELTYRELDERADAVARALLARGVAAEEFVGVSVARSPGMIAALLGVLKAGAAYVGIDPGWPPERVRFLLGDLGVRLVVADEASAAALAPHGAELVDVSQVQAPGPQPGARGVRPADPGLAYAIYTSGSTGTPKAVGIEHRAAVSFVHWARESFPAAQLQGVLATTSPVFDCTLFEIFTPLSWGGSIVVADSVLDLPRLRNAHRVTLVSTVPAAMRELLRVGGLPVSVRAVNLAGDALPGDLVDRLLALGTVETIYNHYGPSETTTYSTGGVVAERGARLAAGTTPSIGRPIANTQVHIVDGGLRHRPIGAAGELCIAGLGLARGYLNRPDLTERAFVPDPWSPEPGARLYRSGDLARWLPDGRLEFLGRIDRQVKVRGFRVEPGEVEACLVSHPSVREAAVTVRRSADGNARLVAYAVPEGAEPPNGALLRQHLRERLPHYMVPSVISAIDELPLTPNGKVDVAALPEPRNLAVAAEDKWRISESTEVRLWDLWCELLELDDLEPTDSFFDLGGHSLLATVMLSRVEHEFGIAVPLGRFLAEPTIEALAIAIRERPDGSPRSSVVRLFGHGDEPPFFCVHPGGADVYWMNQLQRTIRDRRVYGLLSIGFNHEAEPVATIGEMVDHYVREIEAIQPSGPYLIGGFSVGGLVAYEMAIRLSERGDDVPVVALFDTRVPSVARGAVRGGPALTLEDVLRYDGLHALATELPSMKRLQAELGARRATSLAGLLTMVRDARPHLGAVLADLKEEGYVIPDMGLDEFHRLREIWARYLWAGASYLPGPYRGTITLFKSNTTHTPIEEEWARFAARVEAHSVDERHGELFESRELARILARCLARATSPSVAAGGDA